MMADNEMKSKNNNDEAQDPVVSADTESQKKEEVDSQVPLSPEEKNTESAEPPSKKRRGRRRNKQRTGKTRT